jgi:membrane protein YdbS with pleckstrin-like domain
MAQSFHPTPLVAAVKTLFCVVVLTVLLLVAQSTLMGLLLELLAAVWLAGAIFVLFAFMRARFQTITLDDNAITYSGGILATKQVVLPYERITETSYVQGVLERLLGVGTVSIDNASGAGVAICVHSVRYADIKPLLDEMNAKTGKGAGI